MPWRCRGRAVESCPMDRVKGLRMMVAARVGWLLGLLTAWVLVPVRVSLARGWVLTW